jgi:hypothetical protein
MKDIDAGLALVEYDDKVAAAKKADLPIPPMTERERAALRHQKAKKKMGSGVTFLGHGPAVSSEDEEQK